MKKKHSIRALALVPAVLALGACVSGAPSEPSGAPAAGGKSGALVYQQVCKACHETGVAKAPKFGDHEAWEDLIEEGQDVLTAHAWVGVRGMPPRGGDSSLTLAEFARATAFMARAAGGDWQDPDARMLERIQHEEKDRLEDLEEKSVSGVPSEPSGAPAAGGKSGALVYQQVCKACHESGVAKAPKFGDHEAWEDLIKEGQDVLTAHAWVGVRAMPPRGGDPSLTLADFARATAFMARAAGGDWQDPDAKVLDRVRHEEKKRIEEMEEKK